MRVRRRKICRSFIVKEEGQMKTKFCFGGAEKSAPLFL